MESKVRPMAEPIVTSSPDILSGTPVFAGTRVPVQALIDCLEGGGDDRRLPDGVSDRQARTGRGIPGGGHGANGCKGVVRVLLDECVDRRVAGDIPQLLAVLPVAKRGAVTWIGGAG